MIALLSWLGLGVPASIVLARELVALRRQRERRADIERLVGRVGLVRSAHIVDVDSDGATIAITIAPGGPLTDRTSVEGE